MELFFNKSWRICRLEIDDEMRLLIFIIKLIFLSYSVLKRGVEFYCVRILISLHLNVDFLTEHLA